MTEHPAPAGAEGALTSLGLLDGVRVVDASRIIAGPYATQLFADFGADVIKVERPGFGDDARHYERGRVNGMSVSTVFSALNGGKRSVCLDLHDAGDRETLLRIVEQCDVFVQNFRPGLIDTLGIGPDVLRARNPRLIYCTITGFGDFGPLRYKTAVDLVGQAYGGIMGLNGEPGRPPARVPVPVADLVTGLNAAVAILAALAGRERSGEGATIGVSLLESVVGMMSHHIAEHVITGEPFERMGSRTRVGVPNQAFETLDGYVVISSANDAMWKRCSAALGRPELADDPRYSTQAARAANEDELADLVEACTRQLTTQQVIDVLDPAHVPCSPVSTLEDLVVDEQIEALHMLTTQDYLGNTVPVVAGHFRVDGQRSRPRPVPALGEHTEEVLKELGITSGQ